MIFYLVLEFFAVFAVCTANLPSFSIYDDYSSPVSYGASSHSNWYSTNGNRRFNDDKDIFKHSDFTPDFKEEQWDRVDKHVYLHVLPVSGDAHLDENINEKTFIEKTNKNGKDKVSVKEKIEKELEKLENFDDDDDNKKWDRSDDEKRITHVDKHIYLHVLSPNVNQVTVKHPVYTSPQPPVTSQRFPKKPIPAVPVVPVIPLEPEIYLVRKNREQSIIPGGYQKRSTTVTLKPDIFYV